MINTSLVTEKFRQFLLCNYNKRIDIAINVAMLSIILGLATWIFLSFLRSSSVDLFMRQAESLYFLSGINPYRVLIGEISEIKEFGTPNAYPPSGYIYAILFYSWNSGLLTKTVHFILEIIYLVSSIIIWEKIIKESGLLLSKRSIMVSFSFSIFLSSNK